MFPRPNRSLIRRSKKFPIIECLMPAGWDSEEDMGLLQVVVARRQSDRLVLFGTYLVDRWCLGVKDAYAYSDVPLEQYRDEFLPKFYMQTGYEEVTPELAHQMIYGAIDYASEYGFRPHRDFHIARYVLEKPGDLPEPHDLSFGYQDGKPFFVAGPHDDVDTIMEKLDQYAGKGNYEFMAPIGGPGGLSLTDVPEDVMLLDMDDMDDELEGTD